MIKFLAMPFIFKGKWNRYESRLNLVRDNCFSFSSVILHKHYKMVIDRCFAEAHTDRVMNRDKWWNPKRTCRCYTCSCLFSLNMHIRGVKMRKLREEEQHGSWRGPEQQDEAGGKKKYIAERKKKQEGNKKSQAGKKNCEWKCMFYYPLILKIIIFPRITFINFFRNLPTLQR